MSLNCLIEYNLGTLLVDQWLRLLLPVQALQVRSLAGELRSYMSPGQKKEKRNNIKQKQYCNVQ